MLRFAPSDWRGAMVTREAEDGLHAVLRDKRGEHQLWMPASLPDGAPLAALIILDDDAPLRAEAILRFWRHARREAGSASPALPLQRQRRLALALRALDGHLAGASYRAIAATLFGAARVATEPWKTASIRDRTIRLVRSGVQLMQRGYRALLRGRPRR